MRRLFVWKSACRLAALGLCMAALAWSPAVPAQSQPTSPREGLRTRSPPSVLNDPVVQRCRLLAARRTDPKIDNSVTAAVEIAAQLFDLPPIFDAVAACRVALQAYPNEPSVIIPHYTA